MYDSKKVEEEHALETLNLLSCRVCIVTNVESQIELITDQKLL